jgi:hypothetical protein
MHKFYRPLCPRVIEVFLIAGTLIVKLVINYFEQFIQCRRCCSNLFNSVQNTLFKSIQLAYGCIQSTFRKCVLQ